MTKLLSNMALGDKKPSHWMNEMRRLGGNNITDDFLNTLWLQKLSSNARAILSTSEVDWATLPSLADKILEVVDVNQIQNINSQSSSPQQSSKNNWISSLERKIEQLTKW